LRIWFEWLIKRNTLQGINTQRVFEFGLFARSRQNNQMGFSQIQFDVNYFPTVLQPNARNNVRSLDIRLERSDRYNLDILFCYCMMLHIFWHLNIILKLIIISSNFFLLYRFCRQQQHSHTCWMSQRVWFWTLWPCPIDRRHLFRINQESSVVWSRFSRTFLFVY
jgi:hypothetical protein